MTKCRTHQLLPLKIISPPPLCLSMQCHSCCLGCIRWEVDGGDESQWDEGWQKWQGGEAKNSTISLSLLLSPSKLHCHEFDQDDVLTCGFKLHNLAMIHGVNWTTRNPIVGECMQWDECDENECSHLHIMAVATLDRFIKDVWWSDWVLIVTQGLGNTWLITYFQVISWHF